MEWIILDQLVDPFGDEHWRAMLPVQRMSAAQMKAFFQAWANSCNKKQVKRKPKLKGT